MPTNLADILQRKNTPQLLTAAEYLSKSFDIPDTLPPLPLADEEFVRLWEKDPAQEVAAFLATQWQIGVGQPWENPAALQLELVQTMGGRLPVITLNSHRDFCLLTSLASGRKEPMPYPPTVNAVTLHVSRGALQGHRLILLNRAPYSNIPAAQLQLAEDDWLLRSQKLRLRHECAHYECLRLFGMMQNHLLDELVADGMGQLAAFGSFSAAWQRLFFGLKQGSSECTGRLLVYTRRVQPEEQAAVYTAANDAVEKIATMLAALQQQNASELELFLALCRKQWNV